MATIVCPPKSQLPRPILAISIDLNSSVGGGCNVCGIEEPDLPNSPALLRDAAQPVPSVRRRVFRAPGVPSERSRGLRALLQATIWVKL